MNERILTSNKSDLEYADSPADRDSVEHQDRIGKGRRSLEHSTRHSRKKTDET
jgi:hypothetical protein